MEGERTQRREGPPTNDLCSVCHGNFQIPCQANCSHWFCGNCIMMVWQHGSGVQPCKCPLCRRPITLLVPTDQSLTHRHDPEVSHILSKIHTYNRFFGARSPGHIQRLLDLPFLLRRLFRDFIDPRRSLPLVLRARVYIAVSIYTTILFFFIQILLLGYTNICSDLILILFDLMMMMMMIDVFLEFP